MQLNGIYILLAFLIIALFGYAFYRLISMQNELNIMQMRQQYQQPQQQQQQESLLSNNIMGYNGIYPTSTYFYQRPWYNNWIDWWYRPSPKNYYYNTEHHYNRNSNHNHNSNHNSNSNTLQHNTPHDYTPPPNTLPQPNTLPHLPTMLSQIPHSQNLPPSPMPSAPALIPSSPAPVPPMMDQLPHTMELSSSPPPLSPPPPIQQQSQQDSSLSQVEGFTVYQNPNLNTVNKEQIQKALEQGQYHAPDVMASEAIYLRNPNLKRAEPLPYMRNNTANQNVYPPWAPWNA